MSGKQKIPKFLQSALWSYSLDAMSADNPSDRKLIIEQILNYGTQDQLDWLLGNYTKEQIKEVVKNPSRGLWQKDSLNYWTKILEIILPKDTYKNAIFNLNPQDGTFKHT